MNLDLKFNQNSKTCTKQNNTILKAVQFPS